MAAAAASSSSSSSTNFNTAIEMAEEDLWMVLWKLQRDEVAARLNVESQERKAFKALTTARGRDLPQPMGGPAGIGYSKFPPNGPPNLPTIYQTPARYPPFPSAAAASPYLPAAPIPPTGLVGPVAINVGKIEHLRNWIGQLSELKQQVLCEYVRARCPAAIEVSADGFANINTNILDDAAIDAILAHIQLITASSDPFPDGGQAYYQPRPPPSAPPPLGFRPAMPTTTTAARPPLGPAIGGGARSRSVPLSPYHQPPLPQPAMFPSIERNRGRIVTQQPQQQTLPQQQPPQGNWPLAAAAANDPEGVGGAALRDRRVLAQRILGLPAAHQKTVYHHVSLLAPHAIHYPSATHPDLMTIDTAALNDNEYKQVVLIVDELLGIGQEDGARERERLLRRQMEREDFLARERARERESALDLEQEKARREAEIMEDLERDLATIRAEAAAKLKLGLADRSGGGGANPPTDGPVMMLPAPPTASSQINANAPSASQKRVTMAASPSPAQQQGSGSGFMGKMKRIFRDVLLVEGEAEAAAAVASSSAAPSPSPRHRAMLPHELPRTLLFQPATHPLNERDVLVEKILSLPENHKRLVCTRYLLLAEEFLSQRQAQAAMEVERMLRRELDHNEFLARERARERERAVDIDRERSIRDLQIAQDLRHDLSIVRDEEERDRRERWTLDLEARRQQTAAMRPPHAIKAPPEPGDQSQQGDAGGSSASPAPATGSGGHSELRQRLHALLTELDNDSLMKFAEYLYALQPSAIVDNAIELTAVLTENLPSALSFAAQLRVEQDPQHQRHHRQPTEDITSMGSGGGAKPMSDGDTGSPVAVVGTGSGVIPPPAAALPQDRRSPTDQAPKAPQEAPPPTLSKDELREREELSALIARQPTIAQQQVCDWLQRHCPSAIVSDPVNDTTTIDTQFLNPTQVKEVRRICQTAAAAAANTD